MTLLKRLPSLGAVGLAISWPTCREGHEALAATALPHWRGGRRRSLPAQHMLTQAELIDAGLAALWARVIAVEAPWALGRPDDARQHHLTTLAFAIHPSGHANDTGWRHGPDQMSAGPHRRFGLAATSRSECASSLRGS
ncbi:hypothetical protein [Lichenifustis flavocetrariae]|uniref:Uncharacterized protein n=1 Tax=Lichenifustis flavocetrariae TaxID=2949735 RepID=A0AA41YXX5_9HYPH|nr:hypothetical protein [Lichenifustis flavocetrariae]MCW6509296.1 hypothetical protein [Lichenifustis flavocetrariae]